MQGNNPKLDQKRFQLRPAIREEAGLFYSLSPTEDETFGTVGHVRMDFGHCGRKFWHTWWPHNGDRFNTPVFKEDLRKVVDTLRNDGLLKDLQAMASYCAGHGGVIEEGSHPSYGYILDTEHYRYCLRCTPYQGEYNAYLYCYDLDQQALSQARFVPQNAVGRVSFANGEEITFTDSESYLNCIREELPDHPVTGFHYETLTTDPSVRKVVDDAIYDLYGEKNPRQLEDYQAPAKNELKLGGMM